MRIERSVKEMMKSIRERGRDLMNGGEVFEREKERDRENGCLKSKVFISHSFEGYAAEVPHLHEGEARGSQETEFSFLSILSLSHTFIFSTHVIVSLSFTLFPLFFCPLLYLPTLSSLFSRGVASFLCDHNFSLPHDSLPNGESQSHIGKKHPSAKILG